MTKLQHKVDLEGDIADRLKALSEHTQIDRTTLIRLSILAHLPEMEAHYFQKAPNRRKGKAESKEAEHARDWLMQSAPHLKAV